jgi:coenzyme F420-dependent oxidoreductase
MVRKRPGETSPQWDGATTSVDLALPVGAQPTLDALVGMGERAEALGFDRVWVPETWGRDAVTVLATLAERTVSIGISNTVFPVSSRSPAVVGQTAATLQEASDGRYRLGLGTSSPAVVRNWHGMAFEPALRRLREYIEIVSLVMTGDVVDYDGEVFDLSGFRLRCDPPTSPPSIDAATIGPKAVELTGRFADGWQAVAHTPEGFQDRLTDLERGVELRDRSLDDIRVMLTKTCCVLPDGERAKELAAQHIGTYVGGMGTYYREALARAGYEDLATAIYDAWQADDRELAKELVKNELLQYTVVGTPDNTAARLDQLHNDDIDAICLVPPRGCTTDEFNQSMALVGELLEESAHR